jgi:hypothetical protein
MREILVASWRNQPYFSFVRDFFTGRARDDAPPRIAAIVVEIRNLFMRTIALTGRLSEMTAPAPEDREVLEKYCTFWGVTLQLRQK